MINLIEALSNASNICTGTNPNYTSEMFLTDFPQFSKKQTTEGVTTVISLVPTSILNTFISIATKSVNVSRFGDAWRYAMGLFIAHYSTLYLQSYKESSENNTAQTAAASGSSMGMVSSATLGDQSISYDNSAIAQGLQKWGAWNATSYGQQLVTMVGLYCKGGMYIQ